MSNVSALCFLPSFPPLCFSDPGRVFGKVFGKGLIAEIQRRGTHEPCQHEHAGLAETQDDCEELLCGLVQFAVRLEIQVDIDQVSSRKELEDHSGGYDWCRAQFHQGPSIRRKHHAQPVEWIRLVTAYDAVQRHLT